MSQPTTLIMNPDNTFTATDEGWLSIEEWAAAQTWAGPNGVSERSVKRWLAAGQIPGAEQHGPKKKWRIPANAMRDETLGRDEPGGEVAVIPTASSEVATVEPDLEDEEFQEHLWKQDLKYYLDRMPTYIPVRTGAVMLGLGIGYVKANPVDFGILHRGGPNQSDVMPKRIILERAGLL